MLVASRLRLPVLVAVAMCFLWHAAAPVGAATPFVYVTGADGFRVTQFDSTPNGALTALSPPWVTTPSPQKPYSAVASHDGRFLYVVNGADTGSPTVSRYTLLGNGTLTSPTAYNTGGTGPRGVAISPDGASLYVTNSDSDSIAQFDIDANGALTQKSPFILNMAHGVGNFPHGISVSPNGGSVYVANTNSDNISQFDVGPGGALTAKSPATVGGGNEPFRDVAITLNGASVYVPNRAGNAIRQYDVQAGGKLAPKTPDDFVTGVNSPRGAAISRDGESLYVTNEETDRIQQFDIGPTGALAPKSTPTVDVGDGPGGTSEGPYAVVAGLDGSSLYVGNRYTDDVAQYDVDPSNGELTEKTIPAVANALNGFGIATTPGPGNYARPKGATPFRASLVPAFDACTTPNRVHGPPHFPKDAPNPNGSCNSPTQVSAELTIGAPDSNGAPVNSIGHVQYTVIAGAPGGPDDSDVRFDVSITDVRVQGSLSDYTGELQATSEIRITDRLNGPSGSDPATGDYEFPVTVPCDATGSTTIGSTCSITTTLDAVAAGAIPEGKRSVWALGPVRVNDGGADGLAGTTPNSVFARQGVFVP